MQVQGISSYLGQNTNLHPSFKASYVTLSEKNLGRKIAVNVVDAFNEKILPEIRKIQKKEAQEIIDAAGAGKVISKPEDFQNKVNFFALGAGSGSRFKELAQTVGDYNKISLPFKVNENQDVHMLDFAMVMGKHFIGGEGVNKIIASKPTGSFGDIVQHYLDGNPIKDTVVCCGDNVFGDKATSMMEFFTRTINNPDKHVALVGVGRTPQEVAKRFGVLEVEGSMTDKALKLVGFSEKPPLEEAEKLAVDGQNVANTGLFYISKEGMERLIGEIKSGNNPIKKNDTEIYDFANAVKYVHSKTFEWFGIKPSEAADVKVVKKWEDVGEPKALYDFANEVKQGEYLHNFPQKLKESIKSAFQERVHLDKQPPHILFTDSTKVSAEKINNAKSVEGVNIVV